MGNREHTGRGPHPSLRGTYEDIRPVKVDELERVSQRRTPDRAGTKLLDAERAAIEARRRHYGIESAVGPADRIGLALSGGGIRSATFSLGVLQALAGRDLLKHVDYLSTVSGGGYIGTSLQWWWSGLSGRRFGVRPDLAGVRIDDRFPYGADDPSTWRDRAGLSDRPKLLRNLKERGNYLTPGRGLRLLSLSAVVLRSIILSLFFWVPFLTFVLGVLYWTYLMDSSAAAAIVTVLLFAFAALAYSIMTGVHALLGSIRRDEGYRGSAYRFRRWTEVNSGRILGLALLFAFLALIHVGHCRLMGGSSCFSLLPWDAVGNTGQSDALADGQMIGGSLATLAGLFGGLYTYFRTMRGIVTRVHKIPGVTTHMIAVLSAGLILCGVLLFCHGLAVHMVDQYDHWGLMLILLVLFLIGVSVNINHISAHRMYRDRLMEAFMPGFRDALLGRSHMAPDAADTMRMNEIDPAQGPYPIINTNVVLVNSAERRRNIRGGDNFVLTPIYCGSNATGWVHCDKLMDGRMTLPTAMAISGAAANPNTGAGGVGLTRNRVVSALMALLGLRLGYWVPAPVPGAEKQALRVPNHVWPGISSIVPWGHKEDSWFLELTDGGHFENLGIYELVRRRAALILVCDGAQDENFAFEDLQRAQRRIFADFGARLELETAAIERLIPAGTAHRFPEIEMKLAEAGHAVGRITYSDGTEAILVYLKTTLVDDLPLGLLGYRGANPTFPDQSTGDQFFDEEQFEAYRELGFVLAERMLRDKRLAARVRRRFRPKHPGGEPHPGHRPGPRGGSRSGRTAHPGAA